MQRRIKFVQKYFNITIVSLMFIGIFESNFDSRMKFGFVSEFDAALIKPDIEECKYNSNIGAMENYTNCLDRENINIKRGLNIPLKLYIYILALILLISNIIFGFIKMRNSDSSSD